MIIDAILSFFSGLVTTVLGWLPNPSPPNVSSTLSGLTSVWRWFGWANDYLPVTEAVSLVGILIACWGAMWVFRGAVWLLTKAHILGGASD